MRDAVAVLGTYKYDKTLRTRFKRVGPHRHADRIDLAIVDAFNPRFAGRGTSLRKGVRGCYQRNRAVIAVCDHAAHLSSEC